MVANDFRMGLFATGIALSGLGVSQLALAIEAGEPGSVLFDGGAFYPSVGIELLYDDNIFLQPNNEKSSFVGVITPRGRLEFDGVASKVLAGIELESGTFFSSHKDDYLDVRTLLESAYYPTERVTFYGSLGFRREHEARGSGGAAGGAALTFNEPDIYHMWEITGRFGYGLEEVGAPRFVLEAAHGDREYQNNRAATTLQDRSQDELKASVFYKVAPNTSLLLEAGTRQFDYDRANLDSTEYRILAGLNWDASYQTEGFLKVGWARKAFDDSAANPDASDSNWEVGVNWRPLSYSTLTLVTSRGYDEADGASSFVDRREHRITWTHDWYAFLGTTVAYSHGVDDYGNSAREDEVQQFELRAEYRAKPWLLLGAGFTHKQNDSNAAGFDYKDNVIGFQVGINM